MGRSATGITSGLASDLAAELAKICKDALEAVPKFDTPDPYVWILEGIDLGYGPVIMPSCVGEIHRSPR